MTEGASLVILDTLHLFLSLSNVPSLSLAALDSSLSEGAKGCRIHFPVNGVHTYKISDEEREKIEKLF